MSVPSMPGKKRKKLCCFLCGPIYVDGASQHHSFKAPKEKFEEWKQLVPGLQPVSRLCHRHFVEEDLVKGRQLLNTFYPFQKWHLSSAAMPKLCLNGQETTRVSRTPLKNLVFLKSQSSSTRQSARTNATSSHCYREGSISNTSTPRPRSTVTLSRDRSFDTAHASNEDKENTCHHPAQNPAVLLQAGSFPGASAAISLDHGICFDGDPACHVFLEDTCDTAAQSHTMLMEAESIPLKDSMSLDHAMFLDLTPIGETDACDNPAEIPTIPVEAGSRPPAPFGADNGEEDAGCNSVEIHTIPVEAGSRPPSAPFGADHGEQDACDNPAGIATTPVEAGSQPSSTPLSRNFGSCRRQRKFGSNRASVRCKDCREEIKGNCPWCKIRELQKSLAVERVRRRDTERKLVLGKRKVMELRKRLSTSTKSLRRITLYAQDASKEIGVLRKEIESLTENQLEKRTAHLSPVEREVIRTFINKGKAELKAPSGKAHGTRYDANFLMRCLLLKLKSNTTYEHIRKSKILPLPHAATIRRHLSSSKCKFGFNELALESILRELQGLEEHRKWGSLIWDEISLKKDMTWDSARLEWHGVVDYGEDVDTPFQNGIATHALVLMFRPYMGNWVQPIACFASRNAASATVLHELIMKAIILLHNNGAIVKNTVCDGCTSNKSVMNLLGISGSESSDKCAAFFFYHPIDINNKIFWLTDVPHLLKCTRNHVFNHLSVQYAGSTAEFSFYERLYVLEKQKQLKRTYQLTERHIHPTNWEKMNVRLAAQLLSNKVAMALKRYRNHPDSKDMFEGSESTEKMTKMLNYVFDVLNGRFIKEGINVQNWGKKKQILDTFLKILDLSEEHHKMQKITAYQEKGSKKKSPTKKMFVSKTTLQSWRVSILSTIALTEEMFHAGYFTVLTGKFNQDAIERFFGIVRGIDETPTAHSWLQIFRILSLYNPTKMVVNRGNVDNEEDMRVLVKYKSCLINKFKACEEEVKQVRQSFKEKLKTELSIRYVYEMPDLPPDAIKDEMIYDLCGYLLHSRKSLLQCSECKKGLVADEDELPESFLAAEYTASRTKGGLTFVTVKLFKIFQLVEEILFVQFSEKGHVFVRDSYDHVICRMCELKVVNPCCENHPDTLPYLIMEYIRIRYNFESKRYRNLHLSAVRSKIHGNRKESRT